MLTKKVILLTFFNVKKLHISKYLCNFVIQNQRGKSEILEYSLRHT